MRTRARPTFVCPLCGRGTGHPEDVAQQYCPCCGNDVLPKGCPHRQAMPVAQPGGEPGGGLYFERYERLLLAALERNGGCQHETPDKVRIWDQDACGPCYHAALATLETAEAPDA